ncbi:hypothetical protein ACRAKI_06350 [Saccharothrix isguenensis]
MSTLVVPAWRLRWRAPELALVLGERAVALASARRDEADRLRAEALVVFASNRMGRGVRTADRALDALKAAESGSEQETAWRLRVELADSARSVGAPLTGFAAVRPVLEAENVPLGLRAAALVQASECLVSVGRGEALSRALDEADQLYQADPLLDHDTTLLHRALLRAAAGGQHRRWGDLQAATAACRDGLALLDRLKEAESDNGQVRGRLTVELVCGLLDLNKPGEASEIGTPLLERPVRAPSASTTGWLRLALATRVHLPAGRVDQARDLLRDTADSAERHQLDLLLAESLLALAHVHEVAGNLTEALANLRSAHAAERRRARAVYAVRARLAAEFSGVHRRPAGNLHDELGALLRTGAQPAPAPSETELAPEAKQQLRQWRPVQMHRNEGVRVKRSRRAAEDMTAEGISAARAHAADRWRLVQPFGGGEASGDAQLFGGPEEVEPQEVKLQPGGHRQPAGSQPSQPFPAQPVPAPPFPPHTAPTQGRPEHARSGQARPDSPVSPPPTPDPQASAFAGGTGPTRDPASPPATADAGADAGPNADAGRNADSTRDEPATPTPDLVDTARQVAAESAGGPTTAARQDPAAPASSPAGGLAGAGANGPAMSATGPVSAARRDSPAVGDSPAAARDDSAALAGGPVSGGPGESAASADGSAGVARHEPSVVGGGFGGAVRQGSAVSADGRSDVARHDFPPPSGGPAGPVGGGRHGSAALTAGTSGAVGRDPAVSADGPVGVGGEHPGPAALGGRPAFAGGFVGGTGAGLGGGGGFGIAQDVPAAPNAGQGGGAGLGDGRLGREVLPGVAPPPGGAETGAGGAGVHPGGAAGSGSGAPGVARHGNAEGVGSGGGGLRGAPHGGGSAGGGFAGGGGGSAGGGAGAGVVGRGPLSAGDLESAVADQSITSSGSADVGTGGGIGEAYSDIAGSGFSGRSADGGQGIAAGQSGVGSEVSGAEAVEAPPATGGNETGERSVPAAGLIAAAGVVRSGRRRAREAADGEDERSSGDQGSDANVLDTLKAAGLLDSHRAGGRRRARDAEEEAAVSATGPEAQLPGGAEAQAPAEAETSAVIGSESVQWRVEAPQRLRTEEPSIDMFDSPMMVQPAARDDVPPVGLGAAFVKGPVIPTARVPDPPDYPAPPVPDFASPSPNFPAMATVPEQDQSTPEPEPEPDQVPTVPEPDQVPPVPVPDPVPSNPSPEVAPPSQVGSTGFLSAADVEHDDAPVEAPSTAPNTGPNTALSAAPNAEPEPEPNTASAEVPTGVTADAPTASPAADVPAGDPVAVPAGAPVDGPAAETRANTSVGTPAVTPTEDPAQAEDPTKSPFVTAVVVGGKTIDLPAIVEPPPPASDSPSVTRASRRHKSDLSLAELLAEALVAYEDARREDEAAGRVDEDTVPITPVGPPPESAAETTAPIQRVEPAPRFDTWTLPG